MKVHYLLLIPTLATAAFAADSTFERTLNVPASAQVSVATGAGYIHLRPGSDSQVHVVAHLRANRGWTGSGSDVDSRIKEIVVNPPVSQSGTQVTIGERHSSDLYRNITIDYDVTLPRSAAISAASGSGEIDIQDVGNGIRADSGSGSVHARGVQGAASLQTGSGDIELQENGAGDVRAQTGSGSIRLHGVSGTLQAGTGSGSIEVEGKPTTAWRLDTGSGSIHLNVGKSTAFTLNASTGSGGIHIEQPMVMQSELNPHHLSATVNGGGPSINAKTGSGDIRIQ